VLEVVQVEALVVLGLLCEWYEEADQEEGNDKDEEGNCVLGSAPDALSKSLFPVLGRIFIVFLVQEVGEGHDKQTENCVERVERVVDNLEGVDDAVDLLRRGPVLLAAEA
jgi:hypothetical protein